ncbi:MAG: long-chain fatty acid transporter [Alistipes sp.]
MMKRFGFITMLLTLLTVWSVSSQSLQVGGLMVDKDILMPNDMFELSQTQFNFGTARSMAMAGAFTSLGADLSSMSINPAGLGMYRRNEISITPLMTFEQSKNSAANYGKNSTNRFSVGNFGVLINAYEGSGALVSLNIGVGYNRLTDLNYNYSFQQTGNIVSMADMFSKQLDYSGLKANDLMGDNLHWGNVSTGLWPAVLGYKTGLTDNPGSTGQWSPTWIGGNRTHEGIDIGQYATVESRGSVGEYTISMGANINNKLYIGATLGILNVHQEKNYYYSEDYTYPGKSPVNPEGKADIPFQLLHSHLNQTSIVDGTGVNFKLGITYRPIKNLRIGVAVHTPTYYSLERKYQGAMASKSYSNDPAYKPGPDDYPKPDKNGYILLDAESPVLVDDGSNRWSFISPTRLLLGASYTFGEFGLISVDYERDWYNGIRMKDSPIGNKAMYNDTFSSTFKGSNTLRIGLEIKPIPILALRAGFGYSGSWLQDEGVILSSPIAKQITYYSAGIGVMLSKYAVLDFAYHYQTDKMTGYNLFFADEYNKDGSLRSTNASGAFTTDLNRHGVSVTLGFRF